MEALLIFRTMHISWRLISITCHCQVRYLDIDKENHNNVLIEYEIIVWKAGDKRSERICTWSTTTNFIWFVTFFLIFWVANNSKSSSFFRSSYLVQFWFNKYHLLGKRNTKGKAFDPSHFQAYLVWGEVDKWVEGQYLWNEFTKIWKECQPRLWYVCYNT